MELDLSHLPRAVRVRLRQIWSEKFERELFTAIQNQERIAKHFHDQAPVWREGIGERVMAIDPLFRWLIKHHFGQDTLDPKFWDWFRKRYEQFKIKSRAPRPQVGWRARGGPTEAPNAAAAVAAVCDRRKSQSIGGHRPPLQNGSFKKVVGQKDPDYGKPFELNRRLKFQKVYA
jgi:hypothetical protein